LLLNISNTNSHFLIIIVVLIGNLPNLNDVVFCTRSHHKSFVGVPGNVWNSARVSSMNKQQFRGTILLFIFSLGFFKSRQVPDIYSPVMTWRSKQVTMVFRKPYLSNFILVVFERKEFVFGVSSIPYCNNLISTSCDHQVLVKLRKVYTHYFTTVTFNHLNWFVNSSVPNAETFIIRCWGKDMRRMVRKTNIFYNIIVFIVCLYRL
jgi:hypothetical protein